MKHWGSWRRGAPEQQAAGAKLQVGLRLSQHGVYKGGRLPRLHLIRCCALLHLQAHSEIVILAVDSIGVFYGRMTESSAAACLALKPRNINPPESTGQSTLFCPRISCLPCTRHELS